VPEFELRGPDGAIYDVTAPTEAEAVAAFKRNVLGTTRPLTNEDKAAPSRIAAAHEVATEQPLSGRDTVLAAGMGVVEGVPIAGPYLAEGVNKLQALKRAATTDVPYEAALENARAKHEWLRQDRSKTALAGNVVGAVGSMVPVGATALGAKALGITGKNIFSRTAASTASGAGIGAVDAGARSDWDPAAMEGGALWGGGLGAAAPAVGHIVGAGVRGLTGGKAVGAPSTKAIKEQARAVRGQATEIGLEVAPSTFSRMVDRLENVAEEFASDPALQRQSHVVLSRLRADADNGVPLTLEQADKYHKMLGNIARSKSLENPSDPTLARKLADRLDSYMRTLGSRDVVSGDPTRAMPLLKEYRQLWARARKVETIEEALRIGQHRAAGIDKGTRNELRKLVTSSYQWKRFSKDEQKALLRVIDGGIAENIINALGAYGRGILMPSLGGIVGYQQGGIEGALAGLAGGALASRAGARMTTGNAKVLEAMARTGGALPVRPIEIGARNVSQALLTSPRSRNRNKAASR
jgi:hypothetical protein